MTLKLEGVGALVQDDPEPQTVHRNLKPARCRNDVSVEKEDLAWLPGFLRGPLSYDERTCVVLAQNASGEKAQEESYLGRKRRRPESPRQVASALRSTFEDRLQKRPETLDVEVDPLGPIRDPHRALAGWQHDARKLREWP